MSLSKNVFFSYAFQILNTGFTFVASIFIARLLGPEGRGEYSIFLNSLNLAAIWFGFSLPSAIIYYVATNKIDSSRLFTTMLLFSLLISGLLLSAIYLLSLNGSLWYIFPENFQGFWWQMLFVGQFFFTQINSILVAFLSAKKIFIPVSITNLTVAVISIILWGGSYFNLFHLHLKGFELAAFINLVVVILPCILNAFHFATKTYISSSARLVSLFDLKLLFRFTFLVYICNALQFLSYRMDLWFVEYYHNSSETGVYSLAASLAQLIWILPNSMAAILYTYISQTSREEALELFLKYSRIAFYACLFISVILCFIFSIGVPLVYGYEFARSVPMILILFLGIVPFSISIIAGNFFAGTNKLKFNIFGSCIGFFVCLVMDFILIPAFGGIGASLATVCSYLATLVYCSYVIKKYFESRLELSFNVFVQNDLRIVWNTINKKLLHRG